MKKPLSESVGEKKSLINQCVKKKIHLNENEKIIKIVVYENTISWEFESRDCQDGGRFLRFELRNIVCFTSQIIHLPCVTLIYNKRLDKTNIEVTFW